MNTHPDRDVDADTVLALLEDGPHSTTALAAWCATTTKAMTTRLAQLAAAGLVARSHTDGKWHRVTPTVAPALPVDAVLQQLDFAPKSDAALAEALACPIGTIRQTLATLAGRGEVKAIGKSGAQRWARAGWTPDLQQSGRPQKRGTKADAALRMAQGSTSGELTDAEFVARTERPTVKPATDADGQSWWVKVADPALPRSAFTTAAEARNVEMCGKSAAWRKPMAVITIGWGRTDA